MDGHIPQAKALRRPVRLRLHIRREARRHQNAVAAVDTIGRETVQHILISGTNGIHLGRAIDVRSKIEGQLCKVVLSHRNTQLIKGQRLIIVCAQAILIPPACQIHRIGIVIVDRIDPAAHIPALRLLPHLLHNGIVHIIDVHRTAHQPRFVGLLPLPAIIGLLLYAAVRHIKICVAFAGGRDIVGVPQQIAAQHDAVIHQQALGGAGISDGDLHLHLNGNGLPCNMDVQRRDAAHRQYQRQRGDQDTSFHVTPPRRSGR